ncbi:MAG TPA: LPS export ABC transporter periplasmic protein LptC [bacterium (Candidatus Stahlbacteria)]|nr:LPS export ABC transporter periplasmic protein LptC [Candidatus Stahlbacteria bacterium]
MKSKVFIILSSLLIAWSCTKEKEEAPSTSIQRPQEIVIGFNLIETTGGVRSWSITADKAISYEKRMIVYNPRLEFYDENGRYSSTLTSDSGIIFNETNNMKAIGNVELISKDSIVLKTDTLEWLDKERKIFAPGRVVIFKENKKVIGTGFESNPSLTQIKLRQTYGRID